MLISLIVFPWIGKIRSNDYGVRGREMKRLSIVVPVFNEADTVTLFYEAVEKIRHGLADYQIEYWFVDDGSSDGTVSVIESLIKIDSAIRLVEFSRNFGKEAALYAGLEHASADYVAVMDVDLQDPPELLPTMLAGVSSGVWDAVGARRTTRAGEPRIRSWFSSLFYKLINRVSDTHIVEGARDFRVMTRSMVDAILSMTEYNRFSKGIFAWVGFKTKYLEYENRDRVAGTTSWNFWNLFTYSLDGFVNFSSAPLMMVVFMGLVSFLLAIVGALAIIIRAFVSPGSSVFGWPSTIVILLALGGIQMLSLGVVGRYISSIYLEVKKRPIYIVRKVK